MPTKQDERSRLLIEAARLLTSTLEQGALLKTVLELAARVVDAETASLLLLDPKTDELYFDVALGLGPDASRSRLKIGQGIAGSIARERRSEIIADVRADARWSPAMDKESGFVTRSILGVPILLKGRLLGVIEAINKRGGPFDAEDVSALEAFASQAGVAIDNARLFASLREESFKLATVFSQMKDGAVLADRAGGFMLANDAARGLLGAGKQDLRTAFAEMAVEPPLETLMADGGDFTATRAEPVLLIVAGHATRAPLAEGDGLLFVFRDETETRRQELLKRTFLSLISHKLKTPLTSVIGFSEVLLAALDHGKTDAVALKAAKTVNQQGLKVGELVDKLIRYTTLEAPDAAARRADFPADEAVAEALKALKEKIAAKGARVDYPPSGATLNADRAMIVELLKDLLDNALKFDKVGAPVIDLRVAAEGERCSISVTDRGPGLPPEHHEAVFSRFHQIETDFTGQQEGMGLGLPYVRKVAELHGGRATLTSDIGRGTTVTVLWPRRVAP